MLFRRQSRVPEPHAALISALQDEQERAGSYWYNFDPGRSTAGQRVLSLCVEEQRAFVLAAAAWIGAFSRRDYPSSSRYVVYRTMMAVLRRRPASATSTTPWPLAVYRTMMAVLRRRLPFEHDDVVALLDWSIRQPYNSLRAAPQMIKVLEDHLREHELTPELRERIAGLVGCLLSGYAPADARRWAKRLKEIGELSAGSVPLLTGEAWSDVAIADVEAESGERRSAWIELLNHCAAANGSKPSARWSKRTRALLEEIDFSAFKNAVLRWFPLVDRPRTRRVERWSEWAADPNLLIEDTNADVLKGLAWACALWEEPEISRALTALALSAYRKVPQMGPRCVRVGNACVLALGDMPGTEGIGQLTLLKIKVKFGPAQKGIEKALNAAAEREGLPREEIEEMSVPAYGLTEVGLRRKQLGDFTAELAVTGTNAAELRWQRPDGKTQKSVPKAIREGFAEELKELKGVAKDIQKMLPAQRDRVEGLYLEGKSWPYHVWRERYLDHALVGTLARRLIWRFTDGDRAATGVFYNGVLVDRTGRALEWLDASARVELWHPIHESTQTVMAWRDWLAELEIRQPFKQAHREVYLLTDAERATRVYSNRFAAHVLRQHQFNALCAARGWKNKLRLMVDDEYPPASRPIPAHGLRAEFWIEGIGENYGTDTNETGTYLYLATDQVRFYRMDASENSAHAGGGGYYTVGYGQGTPAEPLPLEEVPALVLSEVMRDADLFVGVASVGNDPNWSDGGPEGRFRDYWTGYSFGELAETAKMRKQVLERLVPRLKIADRCSLSDRFLVVRGDMRTYRIHLGSGNILMEPNDQYLCIVPAQGAANVSGKVFLPFEGDRTLAIILSKAFLLAEDKEIKDSTILRQIRM